MIWIPSIHFLFPLNPSVGSRGGWSLSQRSSGERQGTCRTGRQSITGPHRDKRDKQPHTCSHSLQGTNLETPINLTFMFLDGGKKPEYPERTHAYTGRTCKLHTERPQLGVEPETLSLWGNGANHHTTMQPDMNSMWLQNLSLSFWLLKWYVCLLCYQLKVIEYHVKCTVASHYAVTTVQSSVWNQFPIIKEAAFEVDLPSSAFISNFTM